MTDSSDLATRRDCFCPISFKTVSTLDVSGNAAYTHLSLYDALYLLSVLAGIVGGGTFSSVSP